MSSVPQSFSQGKESAVAQILFRKVFDEVTQESTPYILIRGSRPEAALISYTDFEQFQALRQQAIRQKFGQLLDRMEATNAELSDAEIAGEVAAARAEVG